ncbi:hypothetical protein MKW98_016308 [Papaver atlanticum]|uniref:Uncharacterized protein n=1 Tax=Papaver atlanticum TaxID=357466 RepID=A0AAD4XEL9_9MAGN|nr:hypothetical protein MKW98_016308 [Papaver atlanticum]
MPQLAINNHESSAALNYTPSSKRGFSLAAGLLYKLALAMAVEFCHFAWQTSSCRLVVGEDSRFKVF